MIDERQLIERLVAAGVQETAIEGCTDIDLGAIEEMVGCPLPTSYERLMKIVGRGASEFMRDVDIFFPRVLQLKTEAKEMLHSWEEGKLELPEKSFVFAMRYGEQFLFFDLRNPDPDPQVWFYFEGRGEFKVINSSIWNVVETELLDFESRAW